MDEIFQRGEHHEELPRETLNKYLGTFEACSVCEYEPVMGDCLCLNDSESK